MRLIKVGSDIYNLDFLISANMDGVGDVAILTMRFAQNNFVGYVYGKKAEEAFDHLIKSSENVYQC